MARFKIDGLDNFISDLEELQRALPEDLGRAVYEGAKIVTDEIRREIEALPVGKKPTKGEILDYQKEGMLNGLDIAKAQRTDDEVNVLIGMGGYNSHGEANSKIQRSIEAGTSWGRKATPFVRRAINKTKKQAEEAMAKALEEAISRHMGG